MEQILVIILLEIRNAGGLENAARGRKSDVTVFNHTDLPSAGK